MFRFSSFHRGSGAPVTNQSLPLSAISIPYFLRPARITCASGGNLLVSKLAFRRTRMPIGGRLVSSERLTKCVAGGTYARRLLTTVNRTACVSAFCSTTSSYRTSPGKTGSPAASVLVQPHGRSLLVAKLKTAPDEVFHRWPPLSG
ncbi:MAG: hypothetical protein NT049_16655 [Planctomycetota bacterium]|nr:hypothetical protein [Planctomycetota bacterium]